MKLVISILLIIFTAVLINARTSGDIPVVRQNDWMSPIFEDKDAKIEDEETKIIEDVEINVKHYKPSSVKLVFAEWCNAKPDDELIAGKNGFHYRVGHYWTYEKNGRVFAYQVYYPGVKLENNSITKLGCARRSVYVDTDGDGKFELQCDARYPEKIPQWVKELK